MGEARELAELLLAESLPRRWAHTQGVAGRARSIAPILGVDAGLVEAAAWLHDIGYAPSLAATGFHPLDGARYLRERGAVDSRLLRLVAHHSCAVVEARERGRLEELVTEFPPADEDLTRLLDALTYSDMTTDPDGRPATVPDRLSEILRRYGPADPVHRAIASASPQILELAARVDSRLLEAEQG